MEIASILENLEYGDAKPAISVLINTGHTKQVRIIFRKGQEIKEHKTAYPIVVAIVEGAIDFGVGAERQLLKKGMIIALEGNIPHDLKATSDSIVLLSLNKSDTIDRAKQAIEA